MPATITPKRAAAPAPRPTAGRVAARGARAAATVAGSAAKDTTRSLAPQLAPPVAMGVLVLAAAAVTAAKNSTDSDTGIVMGTAAAAFVIAVVAAVVLRQRLDDKKAKARALAFVGVAAGWLTCTAVTGLSLNAVGVLVVLGSALSLHWWRARRIPNHTPKPPPPPGPRVDVYATRWETNVAGQGGALPGSALTDWHPVVGKDGTPIGDRYTLRLVPGRQNLGSVVAALENLRTGLRLQPADELIVERHPTLDAAALQFTVVTRSPVRESQVWPGPSAFNSATGRVSLGPFTDGEGVGTWKAYTDNRLWGGYISGGTGSGKSRMLESIAFSLGGSGTHPTVVWFADGQGGASSPLLVKTADHSAITHEAIHQMLAGMHLIILLRQDENLLDDREGFTPTEDRPGLLAIIDECHKPLSKLENPELAEHTQYLEATIAREGGKVGVALILASQESTLGAFGGAGNLAEMLRSNLLTGNGVILRSKDANAKMVFGVDVNPKAFPDLAGYGFLVDPEPGGRSAPFRGYYVTDEQRGYWPQRIRWRSLDVGAAAAYGPLYVRRREMAAEAKEAVRRRVEARRAGRPVPAGDGARSLAMPVRAGGVAQVVVAQFPVWDSSGAAPTKADGSGKQLHDGHRKVLDALASGHTSPRAVQDATGYSERQVHNLLGELRDEYGLVVGGQGAGEHGRYRLASAVLQ